VLAGIAQLRQFGQGWSSWILQQVLLELLTDEQARDRVEHARVEYVRRQRAFGEILSAHGVSLIGHDGVNAWVPVVDGSAALMRLAAEGIGAAPGELFSVLPDQPPHVRITVGMISRDLEQIAISVARATRISTWGTGSR
jgi:DNA-binding transcriptional MocR family regulator